MAGIFNSSIFNQAIFNTSSVAPVVATGHGVVTRKKKPRRSQMEWGENFVTVDDSADRRARMIHAQNNAIIILTQ